MGLFFYFFIRSGVGSFMSHDQGKFANLKLRCLILMCDFGSLKTHVCSHPGKLEFPPPTLAEYYWCQQSDDLDYMLMSCAGNPEAPIIAM